MKRFDCASGNPRRNRCWTNISRRLAGRDALKKVTSRVAKGTHCIRRSAQPVELFANAPDKRVPVMHRKKAKRHGLQRKN